MPSLYEKLIDPLLKDVREFVVNFSEIRSGEKVLDVGCGTGDQAIYFAKKGAVVTGIDINQEMISCALKKKGGFNIHFQGGDATNLPFLEPVFDVAVISLVLHEIENKDRDKVISEMKRVVKKGGRLIFIDFNCPLPKSMASFFVNLIEFFVGKQHWQNFKSYLKEGGILKILERSKLKLEKVEYLKGGLLVVVRAKNM
jgi:demethylmenaquinone methyltransferase/2-methoxy-6-polyprenyl-1,4-benzoquinol methylase